MNQSFEENWHKLTQVEKIKLIGSFYPDVAEEAQKVLNWFSDYAPRTLQDRQILIIDRYGGKQKRKLSR